MESNPVGETIAGRYELLEVIGRGGQGVVCRARDLELDQEVAVKVIESHAARAPDTVERMAREQQAMQALAGTNAVQFLDMCSANDGALCLVMELLEGQEFEKHLVALENSGQRIGVKELVDILDPIVTTLDRAHSVGIVHRDLKPGNIFLLSERMGGGSRLLDFGFARLSDSKRVTNTGMVMGSPSYIAPEMWKGKGKTADHRVDVYSFAVIVFRALAGELPFPNSSMQETLIAVTQAERPSLVARRSDLPPAVDGWVKRALAIEAEERFFSVRASWDSLLWALGLGQQPKLERTGWTNPPPDADKIRQFLEEPVSQRPAPAQSIWSMAAMTLKRLVGRSAPAPQRSAPTPTAPKTPTAPRRGAAGGDARTAVKKMPAPARVGDAAQAPKAIPTSPPPLPPKRKKSEHPLPLPKPTRIQPIKVIPAATVEELPEVSAQLLVEGVASERTVRRGNDGEAAGKDTGHSAKRAARTASNERAQKRAKDKGQSERRAAVDEVAPGRGKSAAAKPGTPGYVKPRGVGKPKWKSRRHRKSR